MLQTILCFTLKQAMMLSSIFNLDHKLEEEPLVLSDPDKTKRATWKQLAKKKK